MFMRTAKTAPAEGDVVAELIARSELQAQLFNTGEMQRWVELTQPSGDFTLMQPFGGATSHGFDAAPERLAELSRNFRNGNATLEMAQSYVSGDMVVLVYVERQEIEVYGLPLQDWSLRVTQVFRRDGGDWRLVHRHADPLVNGLTLTDTAALAAGGARVSPAA